MAMTPFSLETEWLTFFEERKLTSVISGSIGSLLGSRGCSKIGLGGGGGGKIFSHFLCLKGEFLTIGSSACTEG